MRGQNKYFVLCFLVLLAVTCSFLGCPPNPGPTQSGEGEGEGEGEGQVGGPILPLTYYHVQDSDGTKPKDG